MRIAVTGAAGHLGGVVVRALLDVGASVRVLVHSDRRAIEGLDVEVHEGDVRDPDAVARLVDGCERVFHLAAVISLEQRDAPLMEAVNVEGTRNVLAACAAARVSRVLHASSIHALAAHPAGETIDEDRAPAGARAPAYDCSKAAADALVAASGLEVATIYPTAIVGPFDFRPSPFGEVLLDLYHRRMPGLVAGGFDWVDVRDVARAALAAAERGGRYLVPGTWHSIEELATLVEAETGVRRPRFVSPMWLARGAAPFAVGWARLRKRRPLFTPFSLAALRNHQRVSGERARAELGHVPRPLADSVRDAFAWFGANGRLA